MRKWARIVALAGLAALAFVYLFPHSAGSPTATGKAVGQGGGTATGEAGPNGGSGGGTGTGHPSAGGSGSGTSNPAGPNGTGVTSPGAPAPHGTPRVVSPGTSPSGVICNYVNPVDVGVILPGAGQGQENDLSSVAVSYCAFGTSTAGSVNVGVKNMGAAASATAKVHTQFTQISGERGPTLHSFGIYGAFGFVVASSTPLRSGGTLYAVNGQGSRGGWYVTIQYYARKPCSTSAMQHLLTIVLATVPS